MIRLINSSLLSSSEEDIYKNFAASSHSLGYKHYPVHFTLKHNVELFFFTRRTKFRTHIKESKFRKI